MSLIQLDKVSLNISQQMVLEDISFSVQAGEYIGLIGPNGAGKSTLLQVILGIIKPTKGKIRVNPNVKFGYVPQNYLPKVNFSLSVKEVLKMGLNNTSIFYFKKNKEAIHQVLSLVYLDESFLEKDFHLLSGGQKQRVMIAKSLLNKPNCLLFDEPLSAIDFDAKIKIYKLLAQINKELGTSIIFVSHEIESVIDQCQRVLCINKKIFEGCHPIDFMKNKLTQIDKNCQNTHQKTSIKPIHHHHLI